MSNKNIPPPTYLEETYLLLRGYRHIIGMDEVGRGSFAGPIVAAAVIIPENFLHIEEIHDSKLLSPSKRIELAELIKKFAIAYAISEVSVAYINKYGIGKAGHLAFRKAVASSMYQVVCMNGEQKKIDKIHTTNYLLHSTSSYILVDGFPIQGIAKKYQKAIIKGDQKSISIAAASIIAKVYRDTLMQSLPEKYQKYQFAVHKGYGTVEHRRMIQTFGLSDMHRTSFNLGKYTSTRSE